MRTRSFVLAISGLCLWGTSGCNVGDAARINALAPAVKTAWDDGVSAEAEIGVRAHENAVAAQALGITPYSPGVAAARREKIKQVGEGINKLQPKAQE